jgi:2-oxoisovalerate dehydrogenase E2 component (dihydrolipoyl transacylase)
VKPLANVQLFDPLCEVQSDKATVEITSPFNGVVQELLVDEGQVAKVGAGLCTIEVDGETRETIVDPPSVEEGNPTPLEPVQAPTEAPATERRLHPLDPNRVPVPNATPGQGREVLAKPSIRHFARTKGVDINLLSPGSGSGGRVERRDVEAYLARGTERHTPTESDVVVDLGRTRYNMWKAMTKVCQYIVQTIGSISCATFVARAWKFRILGTPT